MLGPIGVLVLRLAEKQLVVAILSVNQRGRQPVPSCEIYKKQLYVTGSIRTTTIQISCHKWNSDREIAFQSGLNGLSVLVEKTRLDT